MHSHMVRENVLRRPTVDKRPGAGLGSFIKSILAIVICLPLASIVVGPAGLLFALIISIWYLGKAIYLTPTQTLWNIFKWVGAIVTSLFTLMLAFSIYSIATATPEEKAKWDEERAIREKKKETENAEKTKQRAEDRATRQREKAEKAAKKAQFKCLASLNGSMGTFALEVEYSLRDPSSFEHIQSFATPVSSDGMQLVRMRFRARNGFGGMNIETAEARVRNKDCKIQSWSMLR